MPRATLTVQDITVAGITPSFTAGDQANGHQFVNDGNVFLEVKNIGGGACTVTVTTPGTIGGMAIADASITVPATTGDKMIGPFPTRIFNESGGYVYVDIDTGTGVTLAAFRLPG